LPENIQGGSAVLKASKESASESVEVEGYEGRFEKLDGGYTVAFETYTQDADLAPLLKGLPNDQCQAAHWGYVIKGRVTYHFSDRDETFEEGEAYYVPPGHTPELFKGAEVVEFSPTDELQRTIEVAMKNAESAS
jgi:mannose-6-phosphate isomerase-like protein (cupin superfamily)